MTLVADISQAVNLHYLIAAVVALGLLVYLVLALLKAEAL